MELAGASDQAREALRGALGELRRELATTGLQADVSITASAREDRNSGLAFGNGSGRGEVNAASAPGGSAGNSSTRTDSEETATPPSSSHSSSTRLDLFM